MKKLILFFILSSPLILSGQPSLGDGSSGNPYRGTLSSDWTFSGDMYFGKLNVISGTFTIASGSFLRFGTGDTLSITGNGVISAIGTSTTNRVIFTASGTNWGHIYIYSSSPSISELKFCLIEKGDVTLLTDKYGGGIRLNSSNILLENCEIKNNKATHGGGIFVGKGVNPTIKNCYIHNNQATASGGGAYFWTNSYSLVDNCIITYNTSGSGGGGGIFLGGSAKDVTIVNSVISSNTASSVSYGHNIRFNNNTNNPKPKFINSIIWYPANSIIYLSGGSAASTDFENCAIQTPPITYTNCITLNAVNTNPAGPNFLATDGSDWSLQPWSPCIDIGLNNSENSNVPLLDYNGASRVGRTDLGAYESQSFSWQGDDSGLPTLWGTAANWNSNSVPVGNESIYIRSGLANYPTGSAPNYTIASGKSLTMEPGARATFGSLTNNGTLRLMYTSSGFYSLITNSYTRGGSGTEQIQMWLSGGGSELLEDYKWHYISSPVSSLPAATFTGVTLDLAQYVESRPALSLLEGWVAYDGYVYSTGLSNGPTFNTLTPGKGYNFWDGVNNTFTFSGLLNTSDVTMPLGFSGIASLHGFNLLGNPFPSGLNWDDIANGVLYFSYPANTSMGIYFTRDNQQCTYINGVSIPGDVTAIVPPGQAFFVKTYATGNNITLASAARTHNNLHPQYKGTGIIPLVRVAVSTDSLSDETVIRFDEAAKTEVDNNFDAVKMFQLVGKIQVYTSTGGTKLAINGIPFPAELVEIPVIVSVPANGTYSVSATQLQGLDNYNVNLLDKLTDTRTNLKVNPSISFTTDAGTYADRFVVIISDVTVSAEEIEMENKQFTIYNNDGVINILPLSDVWNGKSGSVRIYDVTGRMLNRIDRTEFNKGSVISVPAPAARGVILVEMRSGDLSFTGKTVVKQR